MKHRKKVAKLLKRQAAWDNQKVKDGTTRPGSVKK